MRAAALSCMPERAWNSVGTGPGHSAVTPDAAAGQFVMQGLAERQHKGLAGVIDRHARAPAERPPPRRG